MCSVESACCIARLGPRPSFSFRRRQHLRLFLKKAMVLPKTDAKKSAKRDYHKTSGITRGEAKPKPAVQSSSLQRRVLGPEHPDTLATIGNLASSLGDQGKHAEAEQMERELLDLLRLRSPCRIVDMAAIVPNR